MVKKKKGEKKMKNKFKQALNVVIPILVYGTYAYFAREGTFEYTFHLKDSNGLYGRAAYAISNSSMSSFNKNEALQSLQSNKPDGYYEAVISIANGRHMSSFDKAQSIIGLNEQW